MTGQLVRPRAAAKINLALVVGPPREDGLHPIATVLQRVELVDQLELRPARTLEVRGFEDDVIVRTALERLAAAAGQPAAWSVELEKAIPVAAGLGGGSADAACALSLANELLSTPLPPQRLHELAAGLGADVPFFLQPGPKLAEGVGERLTPLTLPQDYVVLIAIAEGASKRATGEVYRRFDELGGGPGFDRRRELLLAALADCRQARDLAGLPGNDLAVASGAADLPGQLLAAGAFRADVSGAGPAVYGLFGSRREAERAGASLPAGARRWVVEPVW